MKISINTSNNDCSICDLYYKFTKRIDKELSISLANRSPFHILPDSHDMIYCYYSTYLERA